MRLELRNKGTGEVLAAFDVENYDENQDWQMMTSIGVGSSRVPKTSPKVMLDIPILPPVDEETGEPKEDDPGFTEAPLEDPNAPEPPEEETPTEGSETPEEDSSQPAFNLS